MIGTAATVMNSLRNACVMNDPIIINQYEIIYRNNLTKKDIVLGGCDSLKQLPELMRKIAEMVDEGKELI